MSDYARGWIPELKTAPAVKIATYTCREADGCTWFWFGDSEATTEPTSFSEIPKDQNRLTSNESFSF